MREAFLARIRREEGLRLKAYRDTEGKLTIGYGRNLDDKGIYEHEAEAMLEVDLEVAEDELWNLFAEFGVEVLDPTRFMVLTEMCFNLGENGLRKFVNMWVWLKEGDFKRAADEIKDSKAFRQLPKRYGELVHMMRTGKYEGE